MAGVDLFEAFVKVAELGSFSRAADNFQITPAAMTKKINNLESSLGLQLLQRSTRRVDLTESGEALFQQCLKIIQDLKDTAAIVEQLKGEPSGRLRILASLDFGEHFLLPHLADFMSQHPKIDSDLELDHRPPDLNRDDLDIVMGLTVEGHSDWQQGQLMETQYITCCSPSFSKRYGKPKSPNDLALFPIIEHQQKTQGFVFKKKPNIKINPSFCFSSTHSMCMAAINHLGITQLPDYITEPYIKSGRLIEILNEHKADPITLSYSYRLTQFSQKKSKLFIEFINSRIRK